MIDSTWKDILPGRILALTADDGLRPWLERLAQKAERLSKYGITYGYPASEREVAYFAAMQLRDFKVDIEYILDNLAPLPGDKRK